jgi:hypothetical protein
VVLGKVCANIAFPDSKEANKTEAETTGFKKFMSFYGKFVEVLDA